MTLKLKVKIYLAGISVSKIKFNNFEIVLEFQ